MLFNYENLDETTRQFMLQEVDLDLSQNNLYKSSRLNEQGEQEYPSLLREAIEKHKDTWLANELRKRKYINRKAPVNAHNVLAEGQFNRFYMRGLCVRAIAEEITNVQVYRGKSVKKPRSESQSRIGELIPAKSLLKDLRQPVEAELEFGLGKPSSGLTIRLAK